MGSRQPSNEKKITFCDFYKKLMVEDFSLNVNREDLHYGKCAVIGYCTINRGVYFLGNIRITSLSPNLQLPDNVQKVLLLTNLSEQGPQTDCFVEVFGESVLYDKTMQFSYEVSSIPCTTSLDVFRTRCVAEELNGVLHESYHSMVTKNYVPAIKVHRMVPIENAHEIMNCNLRLELIMDNKTDK
ncbi:hypothetical protein HA402_008160 [Bradysia odoriphaga]|nr:hypothetical protein HA402_008160 [Bradysia odoriphaga]